MPQLTKDYLRGFLIPHNFTIDDVVDIAVSSPVDFTTASAFADVPLPQRSSSLFVGATGGTSIDTDLQIVTNKAGSASSAEYTVRDNADSTSVNYGYNQESLISGWINLRPRSVTNEYFRHDVIADGDAGYIVAYERMTGATTRAVLATLVDGQGNVSETTVAGVAALGAAATFGSTGNPCLVQLSDNTFLCIVVIVDEEDEANINVYRSIDGGETFDIVSRRALDETIDVSSGNYTIKRASAAALHGQILLVFSANTASSSFTKKNHLIQYASVDGGGSFKKVTLSTEIDTNSFKSVQVYKTQNQLALAYIAATDEIHNMLMPHAFFSAQSLRTAGKFVKINSGGSANDFAAGSDNNMTSGRVTAHASADGSIMAIAKDVSDNALVAFYSSDARNWYSLLTNATPNSQPSVFFMDTSECIDEFVSATYKGGAVLVHNWTTVNNGESVGVAYLGGFSTVTTQYRQNYYSNLNPLARAQTNFTYLPMILPSSSSELTASGTGTDTISAGYVQLDVTAAQTDRLFTRTQSISSDRPGGTILGEVVVIDDISETVPAIAQLEVELSTGEHWKIKIEFYEGRFEVFDVGIGSTSLLQQDVTVNTAIEYIIHIWGGTAAFYWRYKGFDSLRRYNEGFKNQGLSKLASGATNQTITKFGIDGSPASGTAQARFHKFFCIDAVGSVDMSNMGDSDLIGKRFSSVQPQQIDSGVAIFAQNGPTYIGDEWTIKATSNNAKDNLFYDISPSPRVRWHSEAVTAGTDVTRQRLVLELASSASDFGNDLIALHLSNINFKDAKLQYYDGSVFQTLATFETSSGLKHGYLAAGKTIKQNSSSVFDENYYFYNELKGYIAMLVGGENTEFFNVVSNSEGGFGQVTGKQASVLLDGEPSFNGTVYFIPRDVTLVVNLNGIDANRWALELPAQETIDNQFRIGLLHLGPVAITGTQYSKGRKISIEGGNIVEVTPDKTRYSKAFSPDQRTVSISWSDGVDISTLYDEDPDPDYYESSSSGGAEAVAVYNDTPYMMEGILRGLQGSHRPLVYLPSITTSSDTRVYNRRAQHLLGVIEGNIDIESITGEELVGNGIGEVMRVGTVNIVEVI